MPEQANSLVAATDYNRFQAIAFLTGLEARGGTEMAQPLCQAADLLGDETHDRQRIMVLVTDGQIGNEDHILRLLGQHLQHVRIFALGIDRAVNAGFLERLATLGDGVFEGVESEAQLDEAMDRMHRRIATPVYTELHLEAEGFEIVPETTHPRRLPTLFDGACAVVSGRYRQLTSDAQLILHAVDASGAAWSATISAVHATNPSLTAHWARGHVRDLEDQYLVSHRKQRPGLEARIIDTSLRFHVLSRFTAFVAVDRAEQAIVDGHLHRVTQAVDMPDGWQPSQSIMPSLMHTGLFAERLEAQANGAQIGPSAAYATQPLPIPHRTHRHAGTDPARVGFWDRTPKRMRPDIWRRARELAQRASQMSLSMLVAELEALVRQLRSHGVDQQKIKPCPTPCRLHAHWARQENLIVQRIRIALYDFSEDAIPTKASTSQARSKVFWKADL